MFEENIKPVNTLKLENSAFGKWFVWLICFLVRKWFENSAFGHSLLLFHTLTFQLALLVGSVASMDHYHLLVNLVGYGNLGLFVLIICSVCCFEVYEGYYL